MRQHKRGYYLSVLLLLLLLFGLLFVSVGKTFARYRDEREQDVTFQVRQPEKVLLGTVTNDVFAQTDYLQWVIKNEVAQLEFAVANGASNESYSARDQIMRLRMVGSLGISKDGTIPELSITYVPQRGNGKAVTVTAVATAIVEGTALYHYFGPGWLYSFYESTDEGERELTWKLSGGKLSCIEFIITTEGLFSEHFSLLQPVVSAETIDY